MLFPIRCYTCNKVIGNLYEKYLALLREGKSRKTALDELKITRYCCRSRFLTHRPFIEIIQYLEERAQRIKNNDKVTTLRERACLNTYLAR